MLRFFNQNCDVPIPLLTSLRDSYMLIHRLNNRMTDWLIDRTNDYFLAGWLTERMNQRLTGWLNYVPLKTVYINTTRKKVGDGIYSRKSSWHNETKTRNQILKKGKKRRKIKEKENVRLTDNTEAITSHVWLWRMKCCGGHQMFSNAFMWPMDQSQGLIEPSVSGTC